MAAHDLRIGIDARTLAASRITGVERYVRNLIAHLAALPDLPQCLLYVDSAQVAAAPPVAMGPSMHMRLVPPGRAWLRLRLPLAARRFSWADAAQRTLDVYLAAAGRR